MSLQPGVHTIDAETYHGPDVADEPAFSASIANVMLTRSPLHAWHAHPRLNPRFTREDSDKFDLGTAAHSLFFEGGEKVAVIEGFDDWRKKEAQIARDAAREAGLTPILEKNWARTVEMVAAIRDQLAARDDDPPLFEAGKPEQTIIWREPNGVLCKARLDWLHDDLSFIDDMKSTGVTANAHDWTRRIFWSIGADIEARFHSRGVKVLTGVEPGFRFLVVENMPPYCLSVIDLAPSAIELADRRINTALELWKRCLESGEWPGYPSAVASVETTWQEQDHFERFGMPDEQEAA